ncbi:DUF202 domain-containing protein [Paenibacillus sp. TRM 82003]|nr:DUF202 domain-containing protein [Paenibacillus sp. TRM 82003]
MSNSPSVNDLLALERTVLANERTILAYIRTSVTCLAAAVSLIEFFKIKTFVYIGYALIPVSAAILGFGVYRFFKSKRMMQRIMARR